MLLLMNWIMLEVVYSLWLKKIKDKGLRGEWGWYTTIVQARTGEGGNTVKGGKNTPQRVEEGLSLCDAADIQDYVTCS